MIIKAGNRFLKTDAVPPVQWKPEATAIGNNNLSRFADLMAAQVNTDTDTDKNTDTDTGHSRTDTQNTQSHSHTVTQSQT